MSSWFAVEKRTEWITLALAAVAFLVGFAANYEMRATVIRQTTVKHVARSWGKPDQTIPAGQVAVGGQTLDQARMTQCDYYRSRNTLVCH